MSVAIIILILEYESIFCCVLIKSLVEYALIGSLALREWYVFIIIHHGTRDACLYTFVWRERRQKTDIRIKHHS